MQDISTGDRVRDVRKRRGLTQRELAAAAGVSPATVKKIEQHAYGSVRLETLHKLATALRVNTSVLAAGPDAEPPERADVDLWEPVRRALEGRAAAPDEEPTLGGLQGAFGAAMPLLVDNRYDEVRALLPGLLRDADTLVALSANGTRGGARHLRSQLRQVTAFVMSHTWQFDVAAEAIDLAHDDAGDQLTEMSAVDEQCWGMLRAGRLAETQALAARVADETEPRFSRASRNDLAAWGRIMLRLSTSAVRDNRPGDAADALKWSKVAAVACGGHDFQVQFSPWNVFGPVTVSMIAAEHAVVLERPQAALDIASRLRGQGEGFPIPRTWQRHRLDVARAHVMLHQYGEAVEVLQGVRHDAPEWIVQQRAARDIVARIIEKRRSLTAEMRDLADAVRLPL